MTARGLPWTDFELQCLYDVINDMNWFDQVKHLLACRSEGAIRVKMSLLRSEAEIVPQARGPRAASSSRVERQRAATASAAFLRALEAAAPKRLPAPRDQVQLAMFDGPLFDWRPELELAA